MKNPLLHDNGTAPEVHVT